MKTHRPLLGIFLGFALGIVLNEYFHPPFILAAVSAVGVLFLSVILKNDKIWPAMNRHGAWPEIFFWSIIILAGLLYARQCSTLPWNHIVRVMPSGSKTLAVEGVVTSDVQKRTKGGRVKTVFALQVKRWQRGPCVLLSQDSCGGPSSNWQPACGKVLVNVFRDLTDEKENKGAIHYGDEVILEGKLHQPFDFSPGDRFSYKEYLRRQGIRLILSVKKKAVVRVIGSQKGFFLLSAALKTRKHLKGILTAQLTAVEAGIMNALILGERYDIPEDIKNLFVFTGTAHILAVSGFNVGIVASLLFLFLKILRFPRRWQYILTILLLVFYAFMTGAQPPVVRATIMAIVFLMSFLLEREIDSINTLSLAALLILFLNPLSLFEVGFQLSFVSVLFIILFYTRFLQCMEGWPCTSPPRAGSVQGWPCTSPPRAGSVQGWSAKIPLFLLQSLVLSVVAWLGVLGLVAYYFEIITPVTILANLVIVPVVSFLTALGLGLMLVGLLCPTVLFCFVPLIKVFLNVLIASAYFFSLVPGAFFFIKNVSLWQVGAYYLLIVLLLQMIRTKAVFPSSEN